MATLRNEWISLDQAQQWLSTYDPNWRSEEIVEAMAREMDAGRRPRWGRALLVDARIDTCVDGLHHLLFLVSRGRGGKRWVARATDFVFAETTLEMGQDGRALIVTRMEDSVQTSAVHIEHVQGDIYRFDPEGDAPAC
jgi:hypothetical protein